MDPPANTGAPSKLMLFRLITILSTVMLTLLYILPTKSQPEDDARFLRQFWKTKLKQLDLQGPTRKQACPIEQALDPQACGVCHRKQFADWKGCRMSDSMGSSLEAELSYFQDKGQWSKVTVCLACHAPLAEQQPKLKKAKNLVDNQHFDKQLQASGVSCAVCHVRQHERFSDVEAMEGQESKGTPKLQNNHSIFDVPKSPAKSVAARSATTADQTAEIAQRRTPHGGASHTTAFLDSKFCIRCHQFDPEDKRLNGKLLQDTFQEWKRSPYSKAGVSCQNCHMPEGRHLFLGIHDSGMVARGVTVDLSILPVADSPAGKIKALLKLTSSHVGHLFPTYSVPKVFLNMELLTKDKVPIAGTQRQAIIGRDIDIDVSKEYFDTRLPPGQSRVLEATFQARSDCRLHAWVEVHPDDEYEYLHESWLKDTDLSPRQRQLKEIALARTRNSWFRIFDRTVDLLH